MNDGLEDTASFASLTNWGKELEGCGERSKEKEQGWRQGRE